MDKKRKDVKLPNYLEEELQENVKGEKEKLDEIWDGETIDEDKKEQETKEGLSQINETAP